jgi:hypothetical protein
LEQHLPDGCSYTTRGIEAYLIQIKKESRNWIDKMAFDVFEFVYELKERWDNLKELNRIQWEALDKANRENDFDSQTKISALLCKINDQLLQMVMILPQIAIPAKSSTLSFSQASPKPIIDIDDISNGNGNNNQSKPYVDSDLERDVP